MTRAAGAPRAEAAGREANPPFTVHTVGHSTRTVEELVEILRPVGIDLLVDIRTVPRSRHNPQFNRETLPAALAPSGIAYLHLGALGGLRRPRADSPNVGWRNASFRGYADHLATPEFEAGITQLLEHARAHRTVVMCAEAVPWRCHRSLLADALVVRGVPVVHLLSRTSAQPHHLTPWAKVEGTALTYPEGGREGQTSLADPRWRTGDGRRPPGAAPHRGGPGTGAGGGSGDGPEGGGVGGGPGGGAGNREKAYGSKGAVPAGSPG
jgi:Domain of unknown function DUF488